MCDGGLACCLVACRGLPVTDLIEGTDDSQIKELPHVGRIRARVNAR